MRNALEGIAVTLVVLLSLGIVALIVQYNMIDTGEEVKLDEQITRSLESQNVKKEKKVSSYLDKLEGYEDVDVKVDPRNEETDVNIAVVGGEEKSDGIVGNIGSTVQNVEKRENYISNLEGYEDKDVKVDASKQPSNLNVATVEAAAKEDGIAGHISNVVESTEEEAPPVQKSDEEELTSDPLSDLVSDLDSIIEAAE